MVREPSTRAGTPSESEGGGEPMQASYVALGSVKDAATAHESTGETGDGRGRVELEGPAGRSKNEASEQLGSCREGRTTQ